MASENMKRLQLIEIKALSAPLIFESGREWSEKNLRITTGAIPGNISFARTPG